MLKAVTRSAASDPFPSFDRNASVALSETPKPGHGLAHIRQDACGWFGGAGPTLTAARESIPFV
jgi:hypothetical protein